MIINNMPTSSGGGGWNKYLKILAYSGSSTNMGSYGKILYKNKIYMGNSYTWDLTTHDVTYISPNFPISWRFGGATIYNGDMYCITSSSRDGITGFYRFDGTTWTSISAKPSVSPKSSFPYLWTHGGYLYLGLTQDSQTYYRYNGSTWSSSLGTFPFTSSLYSVATIGSTVYMSGYISSSTQIRSFNGSSFATISKPSTVSVPYLFVHNGILHCVGSDSNASSTYMRNGIYKYTGSGWTFLDYVMSGVTDIADYQWKVDDPVDSRHLSLMSQVSSSNMPQYLMQIAGD